MLAARGLRPSRSSPQPMDGILGTHNVGNGGFEHAMQCVAEYFEEAVAGYRLLGDSASVELLRRAQTLADNPAALEALTAEVDGGPWHGVPWGDTVRIGYARDHRDEFLL
jgi:hypothetical protein